LPTPNPRRQASFDVEKIENFKSYLKYPPPALVRKESKPDMELTLFPRTLDEESKRKEMLSVQNAAITISGVQDPTQYVEWKCSHREWCILATLVITTLVVVSPDQHFEYSDD
jgi:hypothetical protein